MRLASPLDFFSRTPSGEQLFERAVARIESSWVRAWATSERNLSRWLERADHAASRGGAAADPANFATYILLEARRTRT